MGVVRVLGGLERSTLRPGSGDGDGMVGGVKMFNGRSFADRDFICSGLRGLL